MQQEYNKFHISLLEREEGTGMLRSRPALWLVCLSGVAARWRRWSKCRQSTAAKLFLVLMLVLVLLAAFSSTGISRDQVQANRATSVDDDPNDAHAHTVVSRGNATTVGLLYILDVSEYENINADNIRSKLPIAVSLVSSLCKCSSAGHAYNLYIAYFLSDPYMSTFVSRVRVRGAIISVLSRQCPQAVRARIQIIFVQAAGECTSDACTCNNLARRAYLDGVTYYYVISDQTFFVRGWLEGYATRLSRLVPRNIGVLISPSAREHFLHRSHIDMFGKLYPVDIDRDSQNFWLYYVYPPSRRLELAESKVGWENLTVSPAEMSTTVQRRAVEDRKIFRRYYWAHSNGSAVLGDGSLVISMSLYGDDTRYTWGAIRNAQLTPIHYPGWVLRVYMEVPRLTDLRHRPVPANVVRTLKRLGVQIKYIDGSILNAITPMMWRFLVADDPDVAIFVVRDCDSRLTVRDAIVVADWLKSGKGFHCIRDHPSHVGYSISGGMWGARTKALRKMLSSDFEITMRGYSHEYLQDMSFLSDHIYPSVRGSMYCHDSVSCDTWSNSHPFPVRRRGLEHLGQVYDENDLGRDEDYRLLREANTNKLCVPPTN